MRSEEKGLIEFCPKCGTRLVLKRKGNSKEPVLTCPKCGYEKPAETLIPSPRRITEIRPEDHIIVISEKEQKLKTLPVITIECPKCGNNLAYVWQVQTRSADEASTQFFRCVRCGYTWREYS